MKSFTEFLRRLFRPSNLFHVDNPLSFLFAVLFLLGLSNLDFEWLNPVGEAFADVDITDLAYSQLGKNDHVRGVDENGAAMIDTNVVVVNIGYLSRKEIAQEIFKINQFNPKVIGIDAFFLKPKEKDPMGDVMLESAIKFGGNVVMVSEGKNYNVENEYFDSITYSYNKFTENALSTGLANVITDNEGTSDSRFNICRSFLIGSRIESEKTYENAFTVELVKHYDTTAYKALLERGSTEEYINFTGNIHRDFMKLPFSRFKAFDTNYNDPNWASKEDFEGKIVLMGFMGATLDEVTGEDKFFTPLNHKYVGKSNRDMYGVVVHANTISMILRQDYIDSMPNWLSHVIGFLLTYLVFAAFRGIFNDYKVWYDGLTKLLSIIIVLIMLFVELAIFDTFSYRVSFHVLYFGVIAFSGDFLEIYYGLFKNIVYKSVPAARKYF